MIAAIIFQRWLICLAFFIGTHLILAAFEMVIRINFGVIPKCYETVGMLSHAMIPREAVELKGEGEKLGEREILRIVQSLIARVVNVDPNALTRETPICDLCNPPKQQA
jgi:hypothetical protein